MAHVNSTGHHISKNIPFIGKIDRQGLSNIGCKATSEREVKGKLREKEDREGWAIEGE